MIKIFNKTQNKMMEKTFWHIIGAFDYIAGSGIGMNDTLVIIAEDENGRSANLIEIENWGTQKGGMDYFVKKFYGVK